MLQKKHKNYTNLSLNINKDLKDDFKKAVKEDSEYTSMKSVFRDEIQSFIYEYEFNNDDSKYSKNDETLINIELPLKYKERLSEIVKEDNNFFKIKEIIIYIMKRYLSKK